MNPKLENLLRKHAVIIEKTRRELAMNFDVPARDTIRWACADMGISEKLWREMESYSIAKEQSAADRDFAKAFTPNKHGEYE